MGIIGCWINRRAADETGKQRERERVCMGSERERVQVFFVFGKGKGCHNDEK